MEQYLPPDSSLPVNHRTFGGGRWLSLVILAVVIIIAVLWMGRAGAPRKTEESQPVAVVRAEVGTGIEQKKMQAEFAYGTIQSIKANTLILAVVNDTTTTRYTFNMDTGTSFVRVSNDEASTPVPVDRTTIKVGARATVTTDKAVGDGSKTLHAVSVVVY